jgi:hypothetical protein
MKSVQLTIELDDPQASALAQFVKTIGWCECRLQAVDDDEAGTMRDALDLIQESLARAGYAPR